MTKIKEINYTKLLEYYNDVVNTELAKAQKNNKYCNTQEALEKNGLSLKNYNHIKEKAKKHIIKDRYQVVI